ncbi:MAG: DUF2335 domain-containing protein [Pseudomonas sp.]
MPYEAEEELEQQLDPIITTIGQGGELTEEDGRILQGILDREGPKEVLQVAIRTASFSGPLPPPALLAQYDPETRKTIVAMAEREQLHSHEMHSRGLAGMIEKDKRGQRFGVSIAITGLLVAAFISQYSPLAATIIGTLDLIGMVAIFVAPRVLESRDQRPDSNVEAAPEQKKTKKK